VFQVRLRSGREVQATANHPFLTYDGWLPLGELHPGTRVAVPRHVPAPLAPAELPEPEIILLAHLIGDGSFVRRQPLRYASTDEACLAAVTGAARHFGITTVRDDYPAARCTTLRLPAPYRLTHGKRNPVAAWLDGLGLFGLRSHQKFVPEPVFSLPKRQVRLFLRHLWATDGCVWWDRGNGQARIYYASTSRRLVDGVAQLLLRFGISTRLKETAKAGYRTCYQLHLGAGEDQCAGDDQLRFLREIGVHGAREAQASVCLAMLSSAPRNPTSTPSPGRSGSGSAPCWPSSRCRTASSRPRWAPSTAAARCGKAHRAGSGSAGSRPSWTTRTLA
jgi:replicative DNA helicase